jgi:hypothetical protein
LAPDQARGTTPEPVNPRLAVPLTMDVQAQPAHSKGRACARLSPHAEHTGAPPQWCTPCVHTSGVHSCARAHEAHAPDRAVLVSHRAHGPAAESGLMPAHPLPLQSRFSGSLCPCGALLRVRLNIPRRTRSCALTRAYTRAGAGAHTHAREPAGTWPLRPHLPPVPHRHECVPHGHMPQSSPGVDICITAGEGHDRFVSPSHPPLVRRGACQ